MDDVFAWAYVDAPPPDMQYYDWNTTFSINVRNNEEAVTTGSQNRDLTSSQEYWAVHITSAFQGYVDKDNDPDTEQGGAGLQYGITGVRTFFGAARAGSLIFLETIRDDKRGDTTNMNTLQRYTVVHESGHQFLLEHTDGRWPSMIDTNGADDFIMTDKLGQTGMAPNVRFSPTSLKKIRDGAFPPQE